MTARLFMVCGAAAYLASAQTPCLPVTGAQILGEDLGRSVPALKALPPDLAIAPSPLPGSVRTFSVAELQVLAARFDIRGASMADVCFRLAAEPLNRAQVIEAMTDALKIAGVRIEILDMSNDPVPSGRVEFRRETLATPSGRGLPIVWRGEVIYGADRRFSIWARVRITAPVTRVIATENLRPGIPIRADQIREEAAEAFPFSSGHPASLSQIVGLTPLRPIAFGAEVRPDDVGQPYEVNRGDLVHVEVRSGAARLALTGRAESAGRMGDIVSVRNPDSSRIFPARVDGKDSVIVLVRNIEESMK